VNNQPVFALVVLLASVSCRCGSSSSSDAAPPADAAAQCCYPLRDAGAPVPCGEGGAVCNPQMPVPCSFNGTAGSVKACP
jgi:hypothetical protein